MDRRPAPSMPNSAWHNGRPLQHKTCRQAPRSAPTALLFPLYYYYYFLSSSPRRAGIRKAGEGIVAAGLFGDLINPSDFIKRTTLLFILPGSLIASFFFFVLPCSHYLWAICCSAVAVWIRSIKMTLLRLYDPWPRPLMTSRKMGANLEVLNWYTRVGI